MWCLKNILFVLSPFLWMTVAIADDEGNVAAVSQLSIDHQYSGVVIQPLSLPISDEPHYLVVKPDTRKIVVAAAPNDWKKEQESFAQFRQHYMAYWSLFMVMMILDAAWVE